MLTYEEARARALADLTPVSPERVALDAAVGRVLAEDVHARSPQPAFDHSAMDGYAVRAADLSAPGAALPVVGESRTGGGVPPALAAGSSMRIFTGAMVPAGADAVVMQEDVAREGDVARFVKPARPGDHVRRRGEDVAEGSVVLPRGTRVSPFHVALLASAEATLVAVARRPVVSILSTGDELRDAGSPDRAGSVVDANGPGLAALVAMCGGVARALPFARDDREATRAAIAGALEGSDLVLTVGGVSVGDHDVVRAAMEDAGVSLDFWKVAIKPGKPLCVGRAGRARVLGLPGNPSSATLTFVLFGAPLLRALQGDRVIGPTAVEAALAADVRHAPGRAEFVRVTLDESASPPVARPLGNQASGAVTSFAWADALALLPSESGALAAGSKVRCWRLRDV
ncbi:MAG: gephyrin-like molybdotransferase Glp [Polyangiales bacterium]